MTSKCQCDQCGGGLEFEADLFERLPPARQTAVGKLLGQTIECPACGKPTTLFLPHAAATPARVRRQRRSFLWPVIIAGTVALMAALTGLGIVILRADGLGGISTALGGLAGLAVAAAVLVLVLMWIVFPVFVYFQLRKIAGSLTSIDRKTSAPISNGETILEPARRQ